MATDAQAHRTEKREVTLCLPVDLYLDLKRETGEEVGLNLSKLGEEALRDLLVKRRSRRLLSATS